MKLKTAEEANMPRRAARCIVDGCERPHWAKGYCSPHYQRVRKSGHPGEPSIGTAKGDRLAWITKYAAHNGNECLRWPFSFDPSGYGAAELNGKKLGAHRAMCIAAHGPPKNSRMQAAHACGNRWCVNPNHIRWATASQNNLEKRKHGTARRGERNPASKLTRNQVIEARAKWRAGASFTAIANDYGVFRTTIAKLVRGETWNEV